MKEETVGSITFGPAGAVGAIIGNMTNGAMVALGREYEKKKAELISEYTAAAEAVLGQISDETREAIEEMARLCAQPAESMSHDDRAEAISMLEWFQGFMVAAIDMAAERAEQDAKETKPAIDTARALLKLRTGEDITAQEVTLILESFGEAAERAGENLEWLSAALGGLAPKKTRGTRRKRERRMPTRNGRAMMNRVPTRREQHR